MMVVAVAAEPAEDKFLLKPVRTIFVDNVWSGSNVPFALAIRGGKQYIAYYNADRRMTVACGSIGSNKFVFQKLEDVVGWDSHNYVTLAFDSEGYIHLSGNMHGVPLRYYRTTKPEDITTFVRVPSMVGDKENRVTYPRFSTGPDAQLLFAYRDGGSGNGNEIVNEYNVSTRKWRRFVSKPLFDGEGEMNAYYYGPVRDKKGVYHLTWVWRDTGDCSTNHDVSYARSASYQSGFQKSDGTPIELPLTIHNTEIIDPVPIKCGLLNRVSLSFDSRDRVMVTYHKFDKDGFTQVYTARRENSGWNVYETTQWKDRWDFSGGGTIPMMISIDAPRIWDGGRLYQTYINKYQAPYRQMRYLNERTLKQIGAPFRILPADFDIPKVKHTEDWQVNISGLNIPSVKRDGYGWVLRWESAGPNRDRPRDTIPPPSKLELIELRIQD